MTKTPSKTASAPKTGATKVVRTATNTPSAVDKTDSVATEDVAKDDDPQTETTQLAEVNFARALTLPEVPADAEPLPLALSAGSVHAFKGPDRRTMRVVHTPAGLAAQEATD